MNKETGMWLSLLGLAISFVGSLVSSKANKQMTAAMIETEVKKYMESKDN